MDKNAHVRPFFSIVSALIKMQVSSFKRKSR